MNFLTKAQKAKDGRAEIPSSMRFEIFKRDGFRCGYCGFKPQKRGARDWGENYLQLDHVKPWSQGGADTLDNLVTACLECNAGKGDVSLKWAKMPLLWCLKRKTRLLRRIIKKTEQINELEDEIKDLNKWN
tara:strand:- start:1316 stop:1708 length:393 start_codon:yes stop_codon:yes gene_type:complete